MIRKLMRAFGWQEWTFVIERHNDGDYPVAAFIDRSFAEDFVKTMMEREKDWGTLLYIESRPRWVRP